MKQCYKINVPHVVHDTIEGETILVNLKNGNYYSFDKFGVLLWDFLMGGAEVLVFTQILQDKFQLSASQSQDLVYPFIQDLIKEELIVPDDCHDQIAGSQDENEVIEQLKLFGANLETPILHKYENLQDMLFLDPIHDTDEKGWPAGIVVHNTREWNQA